MEYSRRYRLDVSWVGNPVITPTQLGKRKRMPLFELHEDFEFILTIDGDQFPVIIPARFVTDGASVPWIFSKAVPKTQDTWSPALIHDVLYAAQGWGKISKGNCDALFGLALIKQGVPTWRVAAMYEAVRWFGFLSWRTQSPIDDYNFAEGLVPVTALENAV